jgi:hypothetical protein
MNMESTVNKEDDHAGQMQPKISRRNVLVGLVGMVGIGAFGTVACAIGQPADTNTNGGFRTTPALELPTTQADVAGQFLRRQDAILFVGTAGFNGGTRQAPNGTRQAPDPNATRPPYTGPETQVVTNASTKLYKDVTQINLQAGQNAQGTQQKVQLVDTLDNLLGADAANGTLTAWGDKTGEQLVAKVVVFRPRQQRPPATQ